MFLPPGVAAPGPSACGSLASHPCSEPTLGCVLLADVVATSDAVAATRSRNAKIDALAALLARGAPGEIEAVVGFLTGEPRQGRVGIGWATMAAARDRAAESDADTDEPLTVADLDRAIDELRTTTGAGSAGARRRDLAALLARASPAEADFLFRLLTGELRQGALAGLMTDAVARAAGVPVASVRRAAMLGGDLGATAAGALTSGVDALAAVGLQVLRPVAPMLAASAPTVGDALAQTGIASVEWKLDGARIQVHRQGDDVRVFTRNLNDVTDRLPEVVRVARTFPAHALVLDGEAIGVDGTARPERFQDTMSRFGTEEAGGHEMQLSACSTSTAPTCSTARSANGPRS
jgi:DNA ligase-1